MGINPGDYPKDRRHKHPIPKGIKREHILQAIAELRQIKWPEKNDSIKYDLVYEGEKYPPKMVVMYANKYANGELFDVSKFSGGEDTTNKFFRARGFEIRLKDNSAPEFRYNDSTDSTDHNQIYEKNKITVERDSRIKIWKQLQSLDNARNLSPDILREQFRIYRGAAGIWCEKERTTQISDDKWGIAISVLNTGKSYPDAITEDSIVYHYPKTNRPKIVDYSEIEATKNAQRFRLPLFIITHSPNNDKLRDVRLGYVVEWNDENETFLIEFSDSGEVKDTSIPIVEDQPFTVYASDRIPMKGNQLKRDNKFRFKVLKRYGSKCAVCSITVDNLLTAAHIIPKEAGHSTDDERNGIILCHNHHDAFDDHLFSINPETKKIVYRQQGPSMSELKIESEFLSPKRNMPHNIALEWRYKKFLKETQEPVG